jgi:hypothetical protein
MYYSLIWVKLTRLFQQIPSLSKEEWSHKTVSIIYLQAYKMLRVEAVVWVWLIHSVAHSL